MWENLTELFSVMPGIRLKSQTRAGTKWREKRRKSKSFLPLIVIRKFRSLVDKMNKLGALTRKQW